MTRRPIDQIFESLGIAAERDLAECRHGQQSAKRVECFLFENRILFVEILPEPLLEPGKQSDIRLKERVHRGFVFRNEAKTLQIGLWNVVEISAANL